jgi:CRP-like cAMP-binding protein
MAGRDARQLREDAAAAAAAGKHKRALEAYLELERLEPGDAQWPKRAAEMLRRLGKLKEAVAAYDRAVDRYTQGGFLVQAIAVCKLILQLDPTHTGTQVRLSAINEQQGNASTRIGNLVESNVSLHDNPAVQMLRDERLAGTRPPPLGEPVPGSPRITINPRFTQPTDPPPTAPLDTLPPPAISRTRTTAHSSGPPPLPPIPTPGGRANLAQGTVGAPAVPVDDDSFAVATPRTRTGDEITRVRGRARSTSQTPPIKLAPGQALDQVRLGEVMPGAHQHRDDGSQPGITVIPLDAALDDLETEFEGPSTTTSTDNRAWDTASGLGIEAMPIEIEPFVEISTQTPAHEIDAADIEEPEDIDLEDVEEAPLPAPRLIGARARRALAATPLFAGLPMETMEALIARLELVTLERGELVFREGDFNDALYIISEGEIALSSEGPPRVEMSRIGPGAFFGEVSLITEGPSPATAAAIAPATELIKIDRAAMNSVIGDHPDVLRVVLRFVRDRLVDRLVRTSPLFRPFDEGERRELADRFRFLEIDRGALILTSGQRADGLYIVLAGRFEVQRDGGTRVGLGPGDLIGETSLLTGEKVSSPVMALTKSLALCLPAVQFRELIMTHPHVLEYVGEQVEARRKVRMI